MGVRMEGRRRRSVVAVSPVAKRRRALAHTVILRVLQRAHGVGVIPRDFAVAIVNGSQKERPKIEYVSMRQLKQSISRRDE